MRKILRFSRFPKPKFKKKKLQEKIAKTDVTWGQPCSAKYYNDVKNYYTKFLLFGYVIYKVAYYVSIDTFIEIVSPLGLFLFIFCRCYFFSSFIISVFYKHMFCCCSLSLFSVCFFFVFVLICVHFVGEFLRFLFLWVLKTISLIISIACIGIYLCLIQFVYL